MARKRVISPEIWTSNDFSKLTDFAKLVFIGLFSQADDEGIGRAEPSYIRSVLFPYDEERSLRGIKTAISEIGQVMSVDFYECGGNKYYALTNWKTWQKIDRPTKSRFPKPPTAGGEVVATSRGVLVEHSSSPRRGVVELREEEREDNKNIREEKSACARGLSHISID